MPGRSDSASRRTEGLGLFVTITFAVGTMIGAGVFVLSGLVVGVAGPAAVFSYLACGVIMIFSGLSYASLASIHPGDGGGYLYAKRMLGPFPGFLTGWSMYIFSMVATSFVLIGFGIYLNLLLGTNVDPRLPALACLLALTLLNLRGLNEAGNAEVLLVMTKVSILCLFVVFGLMSIKASDFQASSAASSGDILTGITMVFFAYTGFQVAAMMGGEVKESSKKVPIAIMASILIVMAIYVGVIVALVSADLPQYGEDSLFDASEVLIGAYGATLVAAAAVISTVSSANASIVGASRTILEMACERQIPGRFAKLRNRQPMNSILLGSVIAVVFVSYGNLDSIIGVANLTILFAMLLVNLSAFVMVGRKADLEGRKYFKIPFGRLFPVVGAVSCVLMMFNLDPLYIGLGALAVALGMAFYFLEDTESGRGTVLEIRRLLKR